MIFDFCFFIPVTDFLWRPADDRPQYPELRAAAIPDGANSEKKQNFNKELESGAPNYKSSLFEKYVNVSVGTFIPVILLVIFVNTVASKYFGVTLIG